MTPEAQQAAICKALKWVCVPDGHVYFAKDGDMLGFEWGSLDLCAEMEDYIVKAGGTYTAYVSELQRLTEHNEWRATAAQRCEAFLRACGLWVGDALRSGKEG